MIVAAAYCPHPPALVPALGAGIAAALSEVRQACFDAVATMLAADPMRVVVLGSGAPGSWDESAGGTLAGFGVDVRAGGAELVLPLSLTIGAWLLDEAGWTGSRCYGSALPEPGERDTVLVMADGSSRHRRLAPEWADAEGRAFDAIIGRALAEGDAAALASLDLALAGEIGASGTAGLVDVGTELKGAPIAARVRYEGAPFDVGYWVADWRPG